MGVRYEKLNITDQRRYEKYWRSRYHRTTKSGYLFRWVRKTRCWREWEPRGRQPRKVKTSYNFPLRLDKHMLTWPHHFPEPEQGRLQDYDIWYIDRFGANEISRRHYNEILKRVLGVVCA